MFLSLPWGKNASFSFVSVWVRLWSNKTFREKSSKRFLIVSGRSMVPQSPPLKPKTSGRGGSGASFVLTGRALPPPSPWIPNKSRVPLKSRRKKCFLASYTVSSFELLKYLKLFHSVSETNFCYKINAFPLFVVLFGFFFIFFIVLTLKKETCHSHSSVSFAFTVNESKRALW